MTTILNELHKLETGKDRHERDVTSLWKTGYYNGKEIEQLEEPKYLKAWYDNIPTEDEIAHEITINDWSRWNKSLQEGEPIEVSEYIYDHMFECLPPRNWDRTNGYFEVGEPYDHEDGIPIHRAFWKREGKYFTAHPNSFCKYHTPTHNN